MEESVLEEPVLTARGTAPVTAPRPRSGVHDVSVATPAGVDGFPAHRPAPAAQTTAAAPPARPAAQAPAVPAAPQARAAAQAPAAPAAPAAVKTAPAAVKICIAGELPPPAPGQAVPPWLAQFCYSVAIVAAVAGLVGLWLLHRELRTDMVVMSAGVLAATVARLVLPDRMAGMLVSRRRAVDVLILASLGVGLLVVALVLPSPA